MVDCDPTGINPDTPGAAINWDFSSVSSLGGILTTKVLSDTSGVFTTSNLLMVLPNGDKEYVKENNTDSYVNGITDAATGLTLTYNDYDESKRPISYMTTYADTYMVNASSPFTTGRGYLVQTADAYGTIKLPSGTFSNVLRVKKVQSETDTISGSVSALVKVSYQWFDGSHSAPLFQVDSVSSSLTGTSQDAMYLAVAASVKNPSATTATFNGYLNNTELILNGDFEYEQTYDVTIYSLIGSTIYTDEFTAYSTSMRFDIGRRIAPGIYIISIRQKGESSPGDVIKVLKQS